MLSLYRYSANDTTGNLMAQILPIVKCHCMDSQYCMHVRNSLDKCTVDGYTVPPLPKARDLCIYMSEAKKN